LELGAQAIDARYQKIQPQPDEIQELLIKRGVKEIPRRSAEIMLDFDATDDLLHGSQEGAYFHGYYGDYCYLPLYCFCGNIPLLAKLRDCKHDASDGTVEALQKKCLSFANVLAGTFESSCVPIAVLPVMRS
jgi:hypothetical protein